MSTTTLILVIAGGLLVLFVAYMLLMRDSTLIGSAAPASESNIFDAIGDGFAALPGTIAAFDTAFRSSGGGGKTGTGTYRDPGFGT